MIRINVLLLFVFAAGSSLFAQNLLFSGYVMDAETHEPIEFANVAILGTTSGTTTNQNGYFQFYAQKPSSDTIVFSAVGYERKKIPANMFTKEGITINLLPANINLPEVVIVPGENPAEIILRKVISAKSVNNQENTEYYSCLVYNKLRFDLNNFDEQISQRRLLRPFAFVFENTDTFPETNKTFLPVFITESISSYYYRKSPQTRREIIRASNMSGLENESVSRFLGAMYQQTSVYDNFIMLFEKNFVSPIANNGLLFYRYYLTDSIISDNEKFFKIDFVPKRKQELTFTGHMWIHDPSFAVHSFQMTTAQDANINYVNYFFMAAEYEPAENTWVKKRESVIADFNMLSANSSTPGFFAHKITVYQNHSFDPPQDDKIFARQEFVIREDGHASHSDDFWIQNRPEMLSKHDLAVYEMIDSVTNTKAFRTWSDIVQLITTGYYVGKYLEYGPYMSVVSFNAVEQTRFRFGIRTSNNFSTRFMPNAHIAYATGDEKFKYGAGGILMLSKIPRRLINFQYKYDYELLGKSENAFREDFLPATLLTRNPNNKLTMTRQFRLLYEYEWFSGFSTNLIGVHKEMFAPLNQDFFFKNKTAIISQPSIITSEVSAEIRYAYKERFVGGEFERISLGSKYPILRVRTTMGFGDYEYQKLHLSFSHWFNVRTFGWSKYIINAGKTWGTLPYPLLKMHEGNQSFVFDEMAFNMMNYYEFLSSQWVSMYYTHHFDGFFFNRIPLLRKLKLREVVWGKILVGNLDSENYNYNILPENMFVLNEPYVEAGVGIENILKVMRLDAVWRLSHLNNPNISKFTLLIGFQFYL